MTRRPPAISAAAAARYREACALRAAGRAAEALPLLRDVVARAPGRWDAWTDYGSTLADLGDFEAALAAFDKAIARRPDVAAVLQNRGITRLQMNQPDAALADFTTARELRPESAGLRFDAALAHLVAGDLAAGLPLYEARFEDPRLQTPARRLAVPRWTGAWPVSGQRLLLHDEQGLGDTLQFCRYAPLLAAQGASVWLQVQPSLVPLLAGLDGIAGVLGQGADPPPVDSHAPLLSLPLACGTTLETIPATIPYLRPEAGRVACWRERLGPGPHIGLVWAGSPRHRNDARRSLPAAALAPLFQSGGSFVSLQKAAPREDLALLAQAGRLRDVGPDLDDFASTAAAVMALDLVITVDTAVAHLAGALGQPVWILLPHAPDWRWLLDREDSPWYPTARLFRQFRPGDWAGVIRRLADALADSGLRHPAGAGMSR